MASLLRRSPRFDAVVTVLRDDLAAAELQEDAEVGAHSGVSTQSSVIAAIGSLSP